MRWVREYGNGQAWRDHSFWCLILRTKPNQSVGTHWPGLLQTGELTTVLIGVLMATMTTGALNPAIAGLRTARVERILVIEHDKALQQIIRGALASEGYEVELVSNETTGLELVREKTPSALIVDLQFHESPGWDLCRELMQAVPGIPFVVLSATPSIVDKVFFLEMGADDYIAIPFSPEELVARLHALRRRTFQFTPESLYIFGDVMVDFMKMEVVRGRVQIPLALKEFRALEFMIKNARRAISRDELLNKVWGYENYPSTRTVDNHILKLRQKLESDPANPAHLVTIHGLGYKFMP
jgi:DNA-binding response OmpR family regulator